MSNVGLTKMSSISGGARAYLRHECIGVYKLHMQQIQILEIENTTTVKPPINAHGRLQTL